MFCLHNSEKALTLKKHLKHSENSLTNGSNTAICVFKSLFESSATTLLSARVRPSALFSLQTLHESLRMTACWISPAVFTLASPLKSPPRPTEASVASKATACSFAAGGLFSDSGRFAFVGRDLHTVGPARKDVLRVGWGDNKHQSEKRRRRWRWNFKGSKEGGMNGRRGERKGLSGGGGISVTLKSKQGNEYHGSIMQNGRLSEKAECVRVCVCVQPGGGRKRSVCLHRQPRGSSMQRHMGPESIISALS